MEKIKFKINFQGTMPKDAEHYNGLEHREVHNMYGFYQVRQFLCYLIVRNKNSC